MKIQITKNKKQIAVAVLITCICTFASRKIGTSLRSAFTFLLICIFAHLHIRTFAQVANETGAGNCLSYDGVNNYVQFSAGNMPTADRTLELWFYTENSNAPIERQILGYGGNSNNPQWSSFWCALTPDAKTISFDRHYANSNIISYTSATALTFSWHHLAFTTDPTGSKIYLDGQLVASNSTVVSTYVAGKDGFIGAIPAGSGTGIYVDSNYPYWNGKLDEVRIFNRALTQNEIRANMCKKLKGNEMGLVGYWRFDEGSGSTAYDASGNGNNGALH